MGVVINGAVVSFTCLPPTSAPDAPVSGMDPVEILDPGTPLSPNTALVIDASELRPHHLIRLPQSGQVETYGVDVSRGSSIDREELRRVLKSAHDKGLRPRFNIR